MTGLMQSSYTAGDRGGGYVDPQAIVGAGQNSGNAAPEPPIA